jgi:type I restriction enzyme S subunit
MAKTKKEKSIEQMLDEALVKENGWPYRIPDNWLWTYPTSISNQIRGVTYKKKDASDIQEDNMYLILRGGNIQNGALMIDQDCIYVASKFVSEAQQLAIGDVVIVASSGSKLVVGKAAQIMNPKHKTSFGAFLTLLRPNQEINSEYFGWFFQTKEYRDAISNFAQGININNIKREHFESLYFPLPPLEEQKRIVKKLSSMLAKLKEARELVQEAKDSFENRRAAILNKAFTGELTKKWREDNPAIEDVRFYLENIENEIKKVAKKSKKEKGLIVEGYKIPNSWQWRKLDDLSFLITKGASPKWQGINYTNDKNQTLFVTSENVGSGHLILDKEKYVESKFDAKQKRSILKLGDVLLNIVGASIGRAAVFDIEKKSNINQAVALIRLADKKFNRFLNYLLNSEFAKNYYSQNKVDVARANLSLSDVANIPIPLPPLEEQKEIVRILDRILCKEDKSKELIDLEEHIDLLEKSILSKAFRGELGTNNPEDEPAIKLLEKALQSKKLTPAKPKTRRKGITGRQIISTSLDEFSENAQALLKDIKRLFGNTDFNTEKLRDKSNLPYEDFKNSLFELLESKLTMEFDENEEVITYQLKK